MDSNNICLASITDKIVQESFVEIPDSSCDAAISTEACTLSHNQTDGETLGAGQNGKDVAVTPLDSDTLAKKDSEQEKDLIANACLVDERLSIQVSSSVTSSTDASSTNMNSFSLDASTTILSISSTKESVETDRNERNPILESMETDDCVRFVVQSSDEKEISTMENQEKDRTESNSVSDSLLISTHVEEPMEQE